MWYSRAPVPQSWSNKYQTQSKNPFPGLCWMRGLRTWRSSASWQFEKVTANLTKENHPNLLCNDMLTYFIDSRHQPADDFHLLWLKTHFFFSFSESSVNIIFISGFTFTSWKTHFPWRSSQLECKGVLLVNTTRFMFFTGSTRTHVGIAASLYLSSQRSWKWWLRFLQTRRNVP